MTNEWHRPENRVRQTVEQNGGRHVVAVTSLLEIFGRQQLTDKARQEMGAALADVGVGVEPDLSVVTRTDHVELYLSEEAAVPTSVDRPVTSPGASGTGASGISWGFLRPRTWKGWLVYGAIGLVIISAVAGEDESKDSKSPSIAKAAETASPDGDAARKQRLQERREEVRRERVALRRERAELRRQRLQERRAQIAARRERVRREQARVEREAAEAEQAAAAAAAAPPTSDCDSNYSGCVPVASDVDCEGGSGDGPAYVAGPVTVTGSDVYDLDSDSDGTACDS